MDFNVPPISLLKSEAKRKLIKFLLSHDALMSEREIASVLGISHMSVNRTMRELEQFNLVHYVAAGKAHLWKVNRASYMYKTLSRLTGSLEAIPDSISELKQIILKNLPKNIVMRSVLFGSIAKSEGKADSDIDLFILVKNSEDQKKIEDFIGKLSNTCLEIFGNRLSPYILTEHQYKQKQTLDIVKEINKGIQIYPNGKG